MATIGAATIDSIEKAGRYLCGLGGSVGFDEAVRKVQEKASPAVREQVQQLANWVDGKTSTAPSTELTLLGSVVKSAFRKENSQHAIVVVDHALNDARSLAEHVRSGISDGIAYSALLLIVASIVWWTWMSSIGPEFAAMFAQMSASLPAMTQVMVDVPWLVLIAICALALLLGLVIVSTKRLAARIESIAPISGGWYASLLGDKARRLHARWLSLVLARAWVAGGRDPLESIREAFRLAGDADSVFDELESEIQLACELGRGAEELAFQADASVGAYRDALEFRRALGLRFLQVSIALVVGIIVITIYLPLFKLGAIV